MGMTDQAGKRDLSLAAEFCPHHTGLPGSRLGVVPQIVAERAATLRGVSGVRDGERSRQVIEST